MLALHIPLDMPYEHGMSNFRLYLNKSDYIFLASTSKLKISCGYFIENALKPTRSGHEDRATVTVTLKYSAAVHAHTEVSPRMSLGADLAIRGRWVAFPQPPQPPQWPCELPLPLPGLLAKRQLLKPAWRYAQCHQRLSTGQENLCLQTPVARA